MGDRISLAMVFHNHQPVGNFGWVIAETYDRAYLPMVAALERHPSIRVGLHYTGPLLEWFRAERPDFLERLRVLVGRDQVELLGGGYYEPVLASLPERDRLAQLRRMADEIERLGGRRPSGAWLAERVWEPDLPTSIVDAGYRWTILDDAHFRAAAIDDTQLWGAYSTEDQGRLLTVFGSDKALRYGIPFSSVDQMIDHLRANATADGRRIGFMGDDGEKFGAWPDTYEHCWGADGWVDRFFSALEASAPTIATTTPSDYLARQAPVGRVYLPTSSYFEMGEWALPADQGLAYEDAVRSGTAAGAPWVRWLQGGFWRNFQVRYREINDLHKQMLRVSSGVDAMTPGPERTLALDHLHQGQSNDCYWHGVFGGIYISHMRLATLEHLIAAEDLADRAGRAAGRPVDGIRSVDTDLDGTDELLATSPGQVVVIDPVEGGGVGSWDIRAARHALASVMRRRPEAYHARLIAHERAAAEAAGSADPGSGGGAPTIHDVVRSREPGLASRLQYDAYERRSGLVHLYPGGTTADAFAGGSARELGDAHDGAYEVIDVGGDDRPAPPRRGAGRHARSGRRPGRQAVHPRRRPGPPVARARGDRGEPLDGDGRLRPRRRAGPDDARRRRQSSGLLPARRRGVPPRHERGAARRRADRLRQPLSRSRADDDLRAGGDRLVVADRDDLELRVRVRAGLPGQRARRGLADRAGTGGPADGGRPRSGRDRRRSACRRAGRPGSGRVIPGPGNPSARGLRATG